MIDPIKISFAVFYLLTGSWLFWDGVKWLMEDSSNSGAALLLILALAWIASGVTIMVNAKGLKREKLVTVCMLLPLAIFLPMGLLIVFFGIAW